MNEALGPSGQARIRRYWPVAAVALAGCLASFGAAVVGWRSLIVLAGILATTAVVRWIAVQPATDVELDRAARLAIDVLTERLGTLSQSVLTIGQSAPRVSVNERLVQDWALPPDAEHFTEDDLLSAVLRCVKDPDALRTDIAQLASEPGTSIRHDVDLLDGRVFELRATSIEAHPGSPLDRQRSYFFFTDISAQATLARDLQFANMLMQTQVDASPLGMLVVNDAGILTAHNRRFLEIANIPAIAEADSHRSTVKLFAEQTKDPDAFIERVRYLYAHPEERADDEIVMLDDRIIQRHSVPLKSATGQSFGRIWFFADVTTLRTSERSAREERDFISAILDSLPGYFVLIDAAGRLVRWNESLRFLNGKNDDELLGADPFANVVEEDRAEIRTQLGETIARGSSELEFRIHSSRGVRDLRWSGRRITIDGKPHALAIGVDVTDVYAAEAVRRESEKRFRDIFESASEGIVIEDVVSGRFLDANPQMCALFGYTLEEFLALEPRSISAECATDVVARRTSLLGKSAAEIETFEWRCRSKDDRAFWCEFSSRRINNYAGRDVLLSTVREITERRAAREAIEYRDRILHALTVNTAELMRATSSPDSMTALLKAVGEELAVDRLLVIQSNDSDEGSGAEIAYGWQREGFVKFDMINAPSLPAEAKRALDTWFAPLLHGQPVITYAASATGLVRAILKRGGTVSNLLIPIFVGGTYWGHFGVDDTRTVRHWSAIEIDALTTLSDIIGSEIARDRIATALLESEEQFRTVSESVFDAIIVIGIDGIVTYWNLAAERIFGYSSAEAIGKPIHTWLAPNRFAADAAFGMAGFVETGRGAILGKTVELAAVRKDGIEIAVEFSVNPMSVGDARYAVGIARDVTARNKANAAIGHMATHDLLTELPNRRFFIDALVEAIDRSKRSGRAFAVLYLDLDRFKDVNDTLGHPIGDRLLQAAAARLVANVRSIDTVARFGGDEFAAMQIDIQEPADAAALADKIVKVLGEPFDIEGTEVVSAASIGIAVYGPESPDAEALLAHADVALYRAKADGRGVYRFYTESMDAAVRQRVTLERELRDALARGQFSLFYQPQVDLADGRIVGIEALVRWRHPTRGMLQPHTFLPAAEKSGLIVALGAWVFREACRQTRVWLDAGIAPPIVAINLSVLQFKAPRDLEQSIVATLDEYGLSATQIELELTESVMMQATEKYGELLQWLRSMGFRIAIDDFGTGYSSLDYLRRFHVDRITIPKIFLQDLGLVSESAPTVRATIGLAHELGITVAAKGVDNAAQLELLRSWGCRVIQGYYYSAPLSATDAGKALQVEAESIP